MKLNIILKAKRMNECFPSKIMKPKNAHSCHFYSKLYYYSISTNEVRQENIKGIKMAEEKVKLSLFEDNMFVNVENVMESTKSH